MFSLIEQGNIAMLVIVLMSRKRGDKSGTAYVKTDWLSTESFQPLEVIDFLQAFV